MISLTYLIYLKEFLSYRKNVPLLKTVAAL